MARKLTQLPTTQFSGFDYDNIMTDIINLVKDNPNYNENWDDFLSSDAGRMLVELFAYISDQLSTRIDWMVNENWISTATQKRSIMRMLKLIGYNFTLATASEVEVLFDMSSSAWPGEFYLTQPYDTNEGTFSPYSLTASDRKGNNKNYELIGYDTSLDKYDYRNGIMIESTVQTLFFYEGTTYIENFTSVTDNAPSFTLSNSPIINNSVTVYFVEDIEGDIVETELIKVDSFLDPLAQSEEYDDGTEIPLPYILTVNEDETITIEFGSTGILPSSTRRLQVGDNIKIFYRVGGGLDGNLTVNSINTTRTLSVIPEGESSAVIITATFVNNVEGLKGTEAESESHAAIYAPLQLRTVNKAVSADDYDILLNGNTDLITAKVYGAQNASEDTFDKYGVYINPLDVWCYTLPDSPGWRTLSPSDYNKYEWLSLSLENMFNEVHHFREGAFNYENTLMLEDLSGDTLGGTLIDWDMTGDTKFYNYVVIDTPQDFKDNFESNIYFRAKVSTAGDTTQQFVNIASLVFGDSLYVKAGDTRLRVKYNTNAYYQSKVNLISGKDLRVTKKIKINIDGNGDTVINLIPSSGTGGDSSNVSATDIMRRINKALQNSPYGASYGSVTGNTGVASIITPTTSEAYLKITSPKLGDSSYIRFYVTLGDSDASQTIFGTNFIAGDTYRCYGYKRLTVPKNIENDTEYYGKIIYELGTLNLEGGDTKNYYVHYLKTSGDTSALGIYFNENYTKDVDPEYREIARRIYNTYGDTIPNIPLSDFQLRFTKESTEEMSLYAITDDWTLTKSSSAGDSVGDYYVAYNSAEDRMDLIKTTNSTLPDGDFYIHFIWDRRNESTKETELQSFMEDTKIIGLNNVFKQTKFSTFDIVGEIRYDKAYSYGAVKSSVETALYEEYCLLDSTGNIKQDYALDVVKSKILKVIHEIDGVDYVTIDYFGKDATDQSTNEENIITCEFDEIIILSETSGGHGVIFDYVEST